MYIEKFQTVILCNSGSKKQFGTQWSISGKSNQQSTVRWQMCW